MTKRTRHRSRPKPKTAPVDDRDDTELDLAELAVLWAKLAEALDRDSGAGEGRSAPVAASAIHSAATVNVAVADARSKIERKVSDVAAEIERMLRLERRPRSTEQRIKAMPVWYCRLRDAKQPLAEHITEDVKHWCSIARRPLGLETGVERLDWLCPHHPDEPTGLRRDADVARLHRAVIDGRRPPTGEAPFRWEHSTTVRCPHCDKKWVGVAEVRILMRMMEQVQREQRELAEWLQVFMFGQVLEP